MSDIKMVEMKDGDLIQALDFAVKNHLETSKEKKLDFFSILFYEKDRMGLLCGGVDHGCPNNSFMKKCIKTVAELNGTDILAITRSKYDELKDYKFSAPDDGKARAEITININ
jgi:hypothetical protein